MAKHALGSLLASASGLSLLMALAAGEAAAQSVAFEEIVVTAQKRAENIMVVPFSISVLAADRIERLNAAQLVDYMGYVPGLNVQAGGTPGQNQLILRGVTSGRQSSSLVGVTIDDTPVGSSASYAQAGRLALDLMPYDIERIEVLRGPQGTLYGASTMGGLLKYVTRGPDLEEVEFRAGGDLSAVKGGDIGWGMRTSVSTPIVPGKLAIRGSFYHQSMPGFIDNPATGREDENETGLTGGRVALLWQASDDVAVNLSAIIQDIDADGEAIVALDRVTGQPVDGRRSRAHLLPETFDQRLEIYTATINWDFDWAALTSVSSYAETKTVDRGDMTPTFGGIFGGLSAGGLDLKLEKITQEIRLASPGGERLEWLIGGFFTDEDSANEQSIRAFDVDRTPLPGLDPLAIAELPSSYKEYAAFGSLTYRFSDRVDITGGLRWAHNRQSFRQISSGALFNPPVEMSGRSSDDVVTFMVSPRFHLSENGMLYGRIASGYRPGGPNVILPGVPPSFEADKLVNYEIGFKSSFLDGRGMLDIAAFYIDWTDIQMVVVENNFSFLGNGGKAVSKGVEWTTAISPLPGLQLGFNGSYTDATLSEDVPSLAGRDGDRLPNVPKWSAAVTVDYEFAINGDLKANIGGGYRHMGARHSALSEDPERFRFGSHDVLDLNASVASETWTLRLFARNVTNEYAYLHGAANGPVFDAIVLQPRTIGIGIDTRF